MQQGLSPAAGGAQELAAIHPVIKPDEDSDRSLSHLIQVYMQQRQASEEKKLKETTTVEFDRDNLKRFNDFFGAGFSVDHINFESWHRWGEHCQSYAGGEWSNKTARSTLIGSRTFVQWLVKTERLLRLPMNFDDYRISKEVNEPEIFTDDELRTILQKADDELKLYVMLALNTGANQIDLAHLTYAKKKSDIGLFSNQIRRKRVKPKRNEKVPVEGALRGQLVLALSSFAQIHMLTYRLLPAVTSGFVPFVPPHTPQMERVESICVWPNS